jgi:hypothetical protein
MLQLACDIGKGSSHIRAMNGYVSLQLLSMAKKIIGKFHFSVRSDVLTAGVMAVLPSRI